MTEVDTASQASVAADEVADKVQDLSIDEKVDAPAEPAADSADVTATVFKSVEDFSVVHPLTYKWTLWYTKPATGHEEWSDLLKQVVTVSTVEEFWGAYNSIPKVSDLPIKADYSFFKEGIRPEWEDANNAKGGKWTAQFKTGRRIAAVDESWLNVLLGLIGGSLDNDNPENEQINGVFINVRKAAIRISLWTKGTNFDLLNEVGVALKKALGLGERDEIEFSTHDSKSRFKITI